MFYSNLRKKGTSKNMGAFNVLEPSDNHKIISTTSPRASSFNTLRDVLLKPQDKSLTQLPTAENYHKDVKSPDLKVSKSSSLQNFQKAYSIDATQSEHLTTQPDMGTSHSESPNLDRQSKIMNKLRHIPYNKIQTYIMQKVEEELNTRNEEIESGLKCDFRKIAQDIQNKPFNDPINKNIEHIKEAFKSHSHKKAELRALPDHLLNDLIAKHIGILKENLAKKIDNYKVSELKVISNEVKSKELSDQMNKYDINGIKAIFLDYKRYKDELPELDKLQDNYQNQRYAR